MCIEICYWTFKPAINLQYCLENRKFLEKSFTGKMKELVDEVKRK